MWSCTGGIICRFLTAWASGKGCKEGCGVSGGWVCYCFGAEIDDRRGLDAAAGIYGDVYWPAMLPQLPPALQGVFNGLARMPAKDFGLTAIGLSQVISNVLSAILLLNYVPAISFTVVGGEYRQFWSAAGVAGKCI